MTPHKHDGIVIETINALGFPERMTFVLQMHRWIVTEKGFEEVWEDVPVFVAKDLLSGEASPCAG